MPASDLALLVEAAREVGVSRIVFASTIAVYTPTGDAPYREDAGPRPLNAYGLSKRRVTLSTAGVVPALEKLGDIIDVSLAISLHAPNDALRDVLDPRLRGA